jgi:uncharacterized protein (TIGR02118 family)
MVIFHKPIDVERFESRWSEAFVPLGERLPGLRRVSVGRIASGPEGPSEIHLVHEFYFDDAAALRRALASPEGQAAGRALMAFGADQTTLCYADHQEESR